MMAKMEGKSSAWRSNFLWWWPDEREGRGTRLLVNDIAKTRVICKNASDAGAWDKNYIYHDRRWKHITISQRRWPIDEINEACNGSNTGLISSGNLQARDKCFDAYRNGICCYTEVFNAIGIQVVNNNEGGKEPIQSCLAGNEKRCSG